MKMFSAHKRFSETREDLGVREEAAPSIPSEVSTRNRNKAGRDKEKLLKFEQTNRFSGERDAARIKTKGRTSPSGFLSDLDAALSPLFPPPPSVPPKRRILTTFRAYSTIDHGRFQAPSTANDIGPDTIISRATNDQLDGRQSPDIFCPLAFFFLPIRGSRVVLNSETKPAMFATWAKTCRKRCSSPTIASMRRTFFGRIVSKLIDDTAGSVISRSLRVPLPFSALHPCARSRSSRTKAARRSSACE